jgi:ribose transport system ATP-binding protein
MKEKQTITMECIKKSFPGVLAVDSVDLTLENGQVHAIVGENGAGKSTLMKILAGVYTKDTGRIYTNGVEVNIEKPSDAIKLGISIIEQEFSLFSELNVFQNIFLGKEHLRFGRMLIDWTKIRRETQKILTEMGFNIDLTRAVKFLTTSEQQIIEIAKAVFFGAKFIIMDEPTSSLGENEKKILFSLIRKLRKNGVGIVYISHRMEEIFEIADIVTVMRDGKKIGTFDIKDVDHDKIIKMMVGREISDIFKRNRSEKYGNIVLEVKNLYKRGAFRNISFYVREGEILGLSGLMGAQRTEIVRCLFGLDPYDKGDIRLLGKPIKTKNTSRIIRKGVGLVPEDRKRDGIVNTMDVKENISLASLDLISNMGWIKGKDEQESALEQVRALDIKIVSLKQGAAKLSGGNQQKVVLGRFLALKPKLLIMDEPTRGIDVGAKQEVHRIIGEIANSGVAIILISSEMPEILGASDRIIVLHQGNITAEYNYKEATQEKLLESAIQQVHS